MSILILSSSCGDDKFYKEKFDETLNITNNSTKIVQKLKISGADESKVWIFENILPKESRNITFNIRRDIKEAEGSIKIVALFTPTDSLAGGLYFTNWQIASDLFNNVYINEASIEVEQ